MIWFFHLFGATWYQTSHWSSSSLTISFFLRQISSSSSTSAPVNTGVRLPTCKFSMREKFLTSPADLFRVFLNQEVSADSRSHAAVKSLSGRFGISLDQMPLVSSGSPASADGPGLHTSSGQRGRPAGRQVPSAGREHFWRVHRAGETGVILSGFIDAHTCVTA